MKEIVVYKFRVFDEIIKQKVMAVAWGFPGVTSVIVVEGSEGQLEVRGSEFDKYEMTKELKKIDESVDIIKVGPDEEKDPEVNKPPIAETFSKTAFGGDKRPIDQEEVNNPSGAAGSSNWTIPRPYGLWDKAKGIGASAAKYALVIGAGVADKALVIGAGAVGQAKVIGADAAEIIRKRKEEEEKRQKQLKKIQEKKESDRRYMENYKKREEARKKEEDELRQKREKKKKEEARKKEEDERQKGEKKKKEEAQKKEAARKKERETTQMPTQVPTQVPTQGLTGKFMSSLTSFTTGGPSGTTRDPRCPQTYKPDFF